VGVALQAVSVVVQHATSDDGSIKRLSREHDPSMHDVLSAARDAYWPTVVGSLLAALGVLLITAMLTTVVSRAVLGRPATLSSLWSDARTRLPPLAGLTLLLAVGYVAVLLVATLPGILVIAAGSDDGGATLTVLGAVAGLACVIWLWVLFSLAPPALVLERQGIVAALRRSGKLVRGSWWRILGIQLLTVLVSILATSLVQLPFAAVASSITGDGFASLTGSATPGWTYLVIVGIGEVIANAFTMPVVAGAITLLYIDQRIRRESLDIELAKAAQQG